MLKKLNSLIGNKYNYRGNTITITDVKLVSTTFVVKTDKRTYNFFESEIDNFISELIDYVEKPKKTFIMENTPNIRTVSNEENNLSVILLDTIDKLQKDKNYIGQANAICNVVSQMINIKKLELTLKK